MLLYRVCFVLGIVEFYLIKVVIYKHLIVVTFVSPYLIRF